MNKKGFVVSLILYIILAIIVIFLFMKFFKSIILFAIAALFIYLIYKLFTLTPEKKKETIRIEGYEKSEFCQANPNDERCLK